MIPATLVDSQKEDGKTLIEHLVRIQIKVKAACWIRRDEESSPCLYIATPLVTKKRGSIDAFMRICPIIHQIPQPFWLNVTDVSPISPTDPIAKAVLELQQRFPGNRAIECGPVRAGGVYVEQIYVYPLSDD